MTRKQLLGVIILIGGLLALGACAQPPTEQIEAANAALSQAEANADVRQYAPESLARARSLVERMRAEVEAKRYDSAETLALEAVDAAEKAVKAAAAAKEKARTDASSAISSAKSLLDEVRKALIAAKGVRGIKLDATAAETDINAASQLITGAEGDLSKASFAAASAKAGDARSALAGIQRRIADAVQVATRRK